MANPNPNTSGLQPFKPGQSGNPGGKTSQHRKDEIRAAEAAAKVQADLVEALATAIEESKGNDDKLAFIRAEVNALLKNAQDRAYGTPKQHVDSTSSDGSARLPSRILLCGPDSTGQ